MYAVYIRRGWLLICLYCAGITCTQAQHTSKTVDKTVSLLMSAFRQGNTNNCAAIALIKAAMGKFGIDKVIRPAGKLNTSARQYVLRNGDTVTLTLSELQFSLQHNGFISGNTDTASLHIKQLADTCFAIMCKNLQQWHQVSFEEAVESLNAGYKTAAIAPLLGLRFNIIAADHLKRLVKYKHIIVYNYYHAAYAGSGYYEEPASKRGSKKLRRFSDWYTGPACIETPGLCFIKEALEVIDQ